MRRRVFDFAARCCAAGDVARRVGLKYASLEFPLCDPCRVARAAVPYLSVREGIGVIGGRRETS